jgi:hypothetical protein
MEACTSKHILQQTHTHRGSEGGKVDRERQRQRDRQNRQTDRQTEPASGQFVCNRKMRRHLNDEFHVLFSRDIHILRNIWIRIRAIGLELGLGLGLVLGLGVRLRPC